jgi:hypothetical protein
MRNSEPQQQDDAAGAVDAPAAVKQDDAGLRAGQMVDTIDRLHDARMPWRVADALPGIAILRP